MKAPRLPRYGGGDLASYLNDLVGKIEIAIERPPAGGAYTVTNPVPTRSLNVSTATAGDLAKVLGTLIADLQAGDSIG